MAYSVNTLLRNKPATIAVDDQGGVALKAGDETWRLSSDLKPVAYRRDDRDDEIRFTNVTAGKATATAVFGGHESSPIPVTTDTSSSLAGFVAVLDAIEAASGKPGFPDTVKARLDSGYQSLGVTRSRER